MGFFDKIKNAIGGRIETTFRLFKKIDEELLEDIEDILIMADIGVQTSSEIMKLLQIKIKENKIKEEEELKTALRNIMIDMLTSPQRADQETLGQGKDIKSVIVIIGVNGVGKTTSIGKLAYMHRQKGRKVICAAADTFRAAAVEQLEIWARRANCDIIKRDQNSDPASVVYDAIAAFKAKNADVLICDTAGRLHNKKNLMDELKKIHRIIKKQLPEVRCEVFLVLDASTGQNALSQVKEFKAVADITGIILTKLDGTAKGGVVIPISNEQNIAVKFVGVGEGIEDFLEFSPENFIQEIV